MASGRAKSHPRVEIKAKKDHGWPLRRFLKGKPAEGVIVPLAGKEEASPRKRKCRMKKSLQQWEGQWEKLCSQDQQTSNSDHTEAAENQESERRGHCESDAKTEGREDSMKQRWM